MSLLSAKTSRHQQEQINSWFYSQWMLKLKHFHIGCKQLMACTLLTVLSWSLDLSFGQGGQHCL